MRIVQLESRSLRTDPGQFSEVMPWRRTRGYPFQGVPIAPRVVDDDDFAIAVALEDVPDERQHRYAQRERPDRRHDIQGGESVSGQIVGVATRHAFFAQPVLDQEGGVEAD